MKRKKVGGQAIPAVAAVALLLATLLGACAAESSTSPAASTPASAAPTAAASASEGAATASAAPLGEGVSPDLAVDEQTMVDTTQWKKDPPYTVAHLWQGPINGWGTVLGVTVKYLASQDKDIEKLIELPASADADKQISQMEDVIKLNPDVIILEPMSKAALASAAKQAMDAGIPVVSCADGIEGKPYVSYSDVDLYKTGYLSAKSVATALNGKGNVMIINGIPGVDAAETWKQAAADVFAQYPDIKIVGEEYGNWSIATSKDKAAAILAANPNIDGVWAGGSEGAIGALLAIKDAGIPQPVYGTVSPLNGWFRLAIENNIKFTAYPQSPVHEGLYCFQTAMKILNGEPVAKFVHQPDEFGLERFGPATEADAATRYVPELNDDWSGPLEPEVPMQVFIDAGFARQ